jgi:hypothetical protein
MLESQLQKELKLSRDASANKMQLLVTAQFFIIQTKISSSLFTTLEPKSTQAF